MSKFSFLYESITLKNPLLGILLEFEMNAPLEIKTGFNILQFQLILHYMLNKEFYLDRGGLNDDFFTKLQKSNINDEDRDKIEDIIDEMNNEHTGLGDVLNKRLMKLLPIVLEHTNFLGDSGILRNYSRIMRATLKGDEGTPSNPDAGPALEKVNNIYKDHGDSMTLDDVLEHLEDDDREALNTHIENLFEYMNKKTSQEIFK